MSEEWQRRVCQELGLRFVCADACDEGGPNVRTAESMGQCG